MFIYAWVKGDQKRKLGRKGLRKSTGILRTLLSNKNSDRINSLTTNVPHYIETSQLICRAKSINWFLYDGEHWPLRS